MSEIPGTTRDIIEDTIVIDGINYRFIDTAGLRETSDIIESIGIRKTHEKISHASVIMMVDDVSASADEINFRAGEVRRLLPASDRNFFILINKTDLSDQLSIDKLKKEILIYDDEKLLCISARENKGIDLIRSELGRIVESEKLNSGEVIINNIRHYKALESVSESLGRIEEGLSSGLPEDLIAIDIRQAIHYLGEITGEITTDELLGNIFGNFCIGK